MAVENGEQGGQVDEHHSSSASPKKWVLLMLRMVAFLATASATIVMALNKETKTIVFGTFGKTTFQTTLTAKFQDTSAFVFFVIANGMASLHSLTMIVTEILRNKFDYQGFRLAIIAILDMMTVALVSGGVGAALFMAELGKNGNSHARWNKICDKFDAFCDHGAGALAASFAGLLLLLVVSGISILRLLKQKPHSFSQLP